MADSSDAVGCGCALYILVASGIADFVFALIGAYPIAAVITVAALVLAIAASNRRPTTTPSPPPPPPPPFERAEFRLDPPITFVEARPALVEAARCPVCRDALAQDVVTCSRCRTPHHRACFRFARQCAVYACGGRTFGRIPRARWRPRAVRWDPEFRAGLRDFCLALVPEIRRHGGRCVHCGFVSRRFRLVENGASLPHFRCPARGCGRRTAPEILMTPRLQQQLLNFP